MMTRGGQWSLRIVALALLVGALGCDSESAKRDAADVDRSPGSSALAAAAASSEERPAFDFAQSQIDELLAKGYSKEYVFDGKVEEVMTAARYEGKAVVADLTDPRWAVVVGDVKAVAGGPPPLNDDGKYVFLIHSPSRFFLPIGGRPDRESSVRFTFLTKKEPERDWIRREMIVQRSGQGG